MFQNAPIAKAEQSGSSNSAHGVSKFSVNNQFNFTKEGENLVIESSDVIDFFRNVVQPFLAEVRKNDQSRSTVGDTSGAGGNDPISQAVTSATTDHTPEGDPMNAINLVTPVPSSSRVASVADRYIRSMLKCLAGYPLYQPQPLNQLSTKYLHNGINIGDVGFVGRNGTFHFLFNVCPSKNAFINPPELPAYFSLETQDHSVTRTLLSTNCLFHSPITKTRSGEYICEGPEGAILELPEGATEDKAMNIRPFAMLAARYGVQWYEHMMTRGAEISNGSLYLITSSIRCTRWGIAVFDRPCAPGKGLRFDKKRSLPFGKSTSKYRWKGSHAFHTEVSGPSQGDPPNQCVFLRGTKIMIRQDIFDNLGNDQLRRSDPTMPCPSSQAESSSLTRQPTIRIKGGGGSNLMSKILTGGWLKLPWTKLSSMNKSDEVDLPANFNSYLIHPSDLINLTLLSQNPDAKVALTHDDVWCDLLQDNFPKLNYETLMGIARSYMNIVEYDCVSLEKMSNSRKSRRPLQGIETPATIFVPLPSELVECILLLLDADSIWICRLVNREFNKIIQSSTPLRYFLACRAAGVIDNPQSPLSYTERLEALKKREDVWRKLKPVYEMTISIDLSTLYGRARSSEGVLFLVDRDQENMYYRHLPSFLQDNPQWFRIPGHGPAIHSSGKLRSLATALYEHDLIVHMISGNRPSIHEGTLYLVLLKFSTGEYHPLARHPRIQVQGSLTRVEDVEAKIVGDNLALVVKNDKHGFFPDRLFIFNWKTGHKLLQHDASKGAYTTLVFVSPELLLVPNRFLSHFEVWYLPPQQLQPKLPIQILSLKMPAVVSHNHLSFFACHGHPNPFLHAVPHLPQRPFFSSPENSIIVVTATYLCHRSRAYYNIIVHRHALLDMIQTWTSPSLLEQQECLPTWLTNEVTVHRTADPEDGSVQLDARSKLVSTTPRTRDSPTFATFQTFHTSHISAESGSSSVSSELSTKSSISRCSFPTVSWAKWGPPISRWFQVDRAEGMRWGAHCDGQRYAFLQRNPLDGRKSISIVHFNLHNFRRNAEMMTRLRSGEGENTSSNGNKGKEEETFEKLDHKGVFSEEVYMGLKCVVYRAPGEYDFDGVLMNEQSLLGLKVNHNGEDEIFKVLYFG